MRGIRQTSCQEALEALRGADSVTDAARAAGCSRALIYQRAEEDELVRAELERIRSGQRRRKASPTNPDIKLGLETLREICRDSEAKEHVRLAAAKALIAHGEGELDRGPTPGEEPLAPEPDDDPPSAEDVASALRVR